MIGCKTEYLKLRSRWEGVGGSREYLQQVMINACVAGRLKKENCLREKSQLRARDQKSWLGQHPFDAAQEYRETLDLIMPIKNPLRIFTMISAISLSFGKTVLRKRFKIALKYFRICRKQTPEPLKG